MNDQSIAYRRSSTEDAAMQHDHMFVWNAMLDTNDAELTGKQVLDVGCN